MAGLGPLLHTAHTAVATECVECAAHSTILFILAIYIHRADKIRAVCLFAGWMPDGLTGVSLSEYGAELGWGT